MLVSPFSAAAIAKSVVDAAADAIPEGGFAAFFHQDDGAPGPKSGDSAGSVSAKTAVDNSETRPLDSLIDALRSRFRGSEISMTPPISLDLFSDGTLGVDAADPRSPAVENILARDQSLQALAQAASSPLATMRLKIGPL